jgi:hypothetical protein
METKDQERAFRLRPRRPPSSGGSHRRWASGLRQLLRIVQMTGRRGRTGGSVRGSSRRAEFSQRCAVRVTYSANKTRGQWKAHGYYIARESATQKDDVKAAGFSATEQIVNVSERLASWQAAGDERLFKIIVSPEFGERLDLVNHTRELLKRIEKALGTHLEWIAVAHYNTEHPHVHIALRGVDERGAPLRIPRELIQSGIRRFAEDLATKELGYRTHRDALEAQRREVSLLRFTSLDRIIQRNGLRQGESLIVQRKVFDLGRRQFAKAQGHYLLARLGKLEQLGLAAKTGRHAWQVLGNFETVLRTVQQTTDRQKMLAQHSALISDERLPLQITPFSAISVLEGRVLGHGQEDNAERPYLLLEGVEGKIHLLSRSAEMQEARSNGQLRVNSFVRVEKQFARGRAFLKIEDLGDSRQLLQNDAYFRKTAMRLLRAGVLSVEASWGGWLGAYQERLHAHLVELRDRGQARLRQLGLGR